MRKRVPRWRAFFSRLSTIYFLLISSVYSQCNGRIDRIMAIEKTEGYLSSPEFPATYEVGLRCVYELSAPSLSGLVIRVELLVLDISDVYQKSEQCLWDYLIFIIYDREGREHVGARYCGRPQQLPIFNTMQSKMTIMFVSNPQTRHNHTHQGFKLKYNFVPESEMGPPPSIFNDPSNRFRKDCGGSTFVNEISGEITNPGFPFTYPRNITCYWLVRVPVNRRIYLRLTHLQLSSTVAECDRASLAIIDGYNYDLAKPRENVSIRKRSEVEFCGSHLYYNDEGMKSYLSRGNRVVVRFSSTDYPSLEQQQKYEKEGTPIGFKLIWTEVHSLVTSDDNALEENECKGFMCRGGEFCIDDGHNICAARTRLCINETLRCNGVFNCAENDDSDEDLCYNQQNILYGAVLLMILIFSFFVFLVLRCCTKQRMEPVDQIVDFRRRPHTNQTVKVMNGSQKRLHDEVTRRNQKCDVKQKNGSVELVVWQVAPPGIDPFNDPNLLSAQTRIERALV